jgi:hypothetical protein
MFSSAAPSENHKPQRVESTHETSPAAAMCRGQDYDDVAKVGATDRGNFRPGDQANKNKARLEPSFHFQTVRQI